MSSVSSKRESDCSVQEIEQKDHPENPKHLKTNDNPITEFIKIVLEDYPWLALPPSPRSITDRILKENPDSSEEDISRLWNTVANKIIDENMLTIYIEAKKAQEALQKETSGSNSNRIWSKI